MSHLPLLADFSLYKPDLGLLFWMVILACLVATVACGVLGYRLLFGNRR